MHCALLLLAWLAHPAEAALTRGAVEAQARALAAERFPALAGLTLEVQEHASGFDFFSTSVRGAWRPPARRAYVLRVSPRLYADPPEPAALRAILAHELAHVEDFSRMSGARLALLGLRYGIGGDGGFPARYERSVDARVLELGLGPGLKSYRLWLYARLSALDVARKRRLYMTPEEIDAYLARRSAGEPAEPRRAKDH